MIGGGLEGSGPSLPLCAASQHRFTAPTERTPSKGSASNGHPVGETTTSSDDDNDEFQWDYSYFKWQDIPREVRREMVLARSWAARTWIYGKTAYQMDVPFAAARELYNKNWDGCRDLWKEL